MATTPANLMQTAVNAAATITAAFVQGGLVSDIEEAKGIFASTRDDIFKVLGEQPGEPVATASSAPRSSGGGTARGQGGGKTFTADEARALDLIFGKFKGVTLGELETMDATRCSEEFAYEGKNGEPRTGLQYLKYLANNDDPKGSFMKRAASAILEERRASA